MTMPKTMVIQGRQLQEADLEHIRQLIREHPSWHRTRLSQELCALWDWRTANGQSKDMACRSLLRRLHQRGLIQLPTCRTHGGVRQRKAFAEVLHTTAPIEGPLHHLLPLCLVNVRQEPNYASLFACLLHRYHYLGYRGPVGQNMRYLALDALDRPLACLLFGSAAWKCAPRDQYIGWDQATCRRNLHLITNNQRFLLVPKMPTYCYTSLFSVANTSSGCRERSIGTPSPVCTEATAA
jgi:hypothetical protein